VLSHKIIFRLHYKTEQHTGINLKLFCSQ